MNDTTKRFLNTVLERLPAGGEVVELRLFPAIRQGGIESAVAVVAVDVPEEVMASDDMEPSPVPAALDAADGAIDGSATPGADESAGTPDAAESPEVAAAADAADASDVSGMAEVPDAASVQEGEAPDPPEALDASETSDVANGPDAPEDGTPALKRYAILTARYRLTFKGPDRGAWEVDITHEADAPLATVERVARGVARRSGDGSEPEHFSGESLRHALEAPAWLNAM